MTFDPLGESYDKVTIDCFLKALTIVYKMT